MFNIPPTSFEHMPQGSGQEYQMHIQGSVIEQLGLKQYDTASAVVAELVANAWDADATEVEIEIPLNCYLATQSGGEIVDQGYEIKVIDDGFGMDPRQADDKFLNVGRKKREAESDSTPGGRQVMGRKGIGKLAPFGMCFEIEVISAGGEETDEGYEISHFILKYHDIEDTDPGIAYEPEKGDLDGEFHGDSGTAIVLRDFDFKRVPDKPQFSNMLSYRFADGLPDFKIKISDVREDGYPPFDLSETDQPLREGTQIDVSEEPIIVEADGDRVIEHFARGRMGLATESYDNEMQGVRIYVRDKLATVTRDFKIASGFHMENTIRSYLVGEIHCDFLDDEMDCIQANRQDILWDTKYGRALKSWGQDRVREVAQKTREPKRRSTKEEFFEKTNFQEQASDRFDDDRLVESSTRIAEELSGVIDEDELSDDDFLDHFVDLILQIAPHDMVLRTFRKIREETSSGDLDLDQLSELIERTSLAETHSLAQVAREKIEVIENLDRMIRERVEDESKFQHVVENATWLINPEWQALTEDRSISTFRGEFESWYEDEYGDSITTSSTQHERKRPDFIMVSRRNSLIVIEIKPPGHVFRSPDFERFANYCEAFEEYQGTNNRIFERRFPRGVEFVLIADEVKLPYAEEQAFRNLLGSYGYEPEPFSWHEILEKSQSRYEDFIEAL